MVLQECAKPSNGDTPNCLWDGSYDKQGVAVLVRPGLTVTRGPRRSKIAHSVFPFVVHGSTPLRIVAVWAKPEPDYVGAISAGLDAYADFILEGPAIVVGDFNSAPTLLAHGSAEAHAALCKRLNNDFGLVSAYHAATGGIHESEPGTYYFRWDTSRPFHLDYCFLPRAWASRLLVRLGGPNEYQSSDHRPIFVEASGLE